MRLAFCAALLLSACALGDDGAPEPARATATAAAPAGQLWVGNKGENTVSVIDLASGEEIDRLPTSHGAPHEIAPSPDGSRVAVVNYADHHIDIFSAATRQRLDTIDLGENTRPHGLVWLEDGRIIATTEGNQSIVEIAPDGTQTTIRTGEDGTHMLAVGANGRRAFTANLGAGTVSLIDLQTDSLIKTVPAGAGTEGIALTPDGRELWVSNRSANTVIVFDADDLSERARIPVGRFPLRLLISPDGRTAVTSDLLDGGLTLIDVPTRAVRAQLPVAGPDANSQQVTLLFNADGSRLYVAETGTDTVAEVDMAAGRVLRRFAVGRQGDGLAIVKP